MRDLKATVVTAIATYPLRLIEAAREDGIDLAHSRSGSASSLGDVADELRARIERESHPDFDIIA